MFGKKKCTLQRSLYEWIFYLHYFSIAKNTFYLNYIHENKYPRHFIKPNIHENKCPQDIRLLQFNWTIFGITRPTDLKTADLVAPKHASKSQYYHLLKPSSYFQILLLCLCVSKGKKRSFFGKFGVFCFLVTPVLRLALLPYFQRSIHFYRLFSLYLTWSILNSFMTEAHII